MSGTAALCMRRKCREVHKSKYRRPNDDQAVIKHKSYVQDRFQRKAPRSSMHIPHFNLTKMDPAKLHLPITDINLCLHFDTQGQCDEQSELSVVRYPRQRKQVDPPRANHFSLWFGFGGAESVMLDVVQDCPPSDPYLIDVADACHVPAVVRLASKTIPTSDNMACVLRELGGRRGATLEEVISLLVDGGRHRYRFVPRHKQQGGCRYWIYVVARDLEERGVAGKGFSEDVLACLRTYYGRFPYQTPSRRWEYGGNWGPRKEFGCAELVTGSFYYEDDGYLLHPN